MTARRCLDQRLRLHLLRAVDAIEKHRSLLKASVALGVSQPALTKSLHKLEDILQLRLFNRHPRSGSRVCAVPARLRDRDRGLADMLQRPPLAEHVMRNVFFDTCVYHQPGIDLLFRVIDVGNILFGSEMVGAVRGIDPETGHPFDDTKRYIDALPISAQDKRRVFELNARHVYPRLDAILKQGR
jgi:hypothetical protein